ncbi:flavin reductase family protein [Sporolactobacillus laevolacticus]|uniref:flavin reductase family protein n=1 Tax=Sporolactobacillus laevolacticus TaxID=33018 RepID=UPI0025B5C66E|nr:flavin reductase family protein [Sporolactobacillus laevolacticus]MDN3956411.1 flavin reductase family protein [Sporolactobacillus laevolacticus]
MISIDPNALPGRENYKFLSGSIIPRPVAFVTTQSSEGILNAAPFSYFNIITDEPPMISVSVQRLNGEMKDTSRNAVEKGEFVVHISDESYIDQINNTAKPLSSNESEVEDSGLTPVNSIKVSVQGVKEANIRLECVLERAIELGGTDGNPSCDLLIGRVVYYHIREDLYKKGRINAAGLKPVSRLAGSTYAKLGETFELTRPV